MTDSDRGPAGSDGLQNAPSAVRIELLGGEQPAVEDIAMPGPGSSGPSRLPAAAMLVALLAVFGGVWWLSNIESAEDDTALEEPAIVEEIGGDADEVLEANPLEADLMLALDIDPTYAVHTNSGVMVGGAWVDGVGQERVGLSGLMINGRLFWREAPMAPLRQDHRLVGLYDDGDRFIAFTSIATVSGTATELVLHTAESGRGDETWSELSRFPVDGHVRTVSSRDGQWAAIVDRRAQSSSAAPPMQTQILTGRVDGAPDETTLIEVAPDEFVSSFAASSDGFYAIVVRLELGSLSSSRPPTPQLRQWITSIGWQVIEEDFRPPDGVSARVIDAGTNGIVISWRSDLFRVEPELPVSEWPEIASGTAVVGALDDTFTPEASPARIGEGYLIVDRTVGDVGLIWVSVNGALWQRFSIDTPIQNVTLLTIDESGDAILTGEADGQPVLFRRGLTRSANGTGVSAADIANNTPAFEAEVQQRDIVDGEWSTPVFSAASVDGAGFVGLSNVNGQISLVESANGFDVDRTTATNFPFGYFTNEMRTTNAGYHVVGQLGLFEDAVFTSADGLEWQRFPIEIPGTATALQIDHFHRTARAAVMAGSLGWADDLERTELTLLWWNDVGAATTVPPRPCGETVLRCSLLDVVAVDDGVVAAHQVGDGMAISRWTAATGWQVRLDLDAMPGDTPDGDSVVLSAIDSERVLLFGFGRVVESLDAGQSWRFTQIGPRGVLGAFASVSGDLGTAVFLSADGNDAWVLTDGIWSRFTLDTVSLGSPLAIADGIALFGGGSGAGSVVIRFAPAGTS